MAVGAYNAVKVSDLEVATVLAREHRGDLLSAVVSNFLRSVYIRFTGTDASGNRRHP